MPWARREANRARDGHVPRDAVNHTGGLNTEHKGIPWHTPSRTYRGQHSRSQGIGGSRHEPTTLHCQCSLRPARTRLGPSTITSESRGRAYFIESNSQRFARTRMETALRRRTVMYVRDEVNRHRWAIRCTRASREHTPSRTSRGPYSQSPGVSGLHNEP